MKKYCNSSQKQYCWVVLRVDKLSQGNTTMIILQGDKLSQENVFSFIYFITTQSMKKYCSSSQKQYCRVVVRADKLSQDNTTIVDVSKAAVRFVPDQRVSPVKWKEILVPMGQYARPTPL